MAGHRSVEDRFWSKVTKASGDGCWLWTAATSGGGYGYFRVGDRMLPAHRVAYELAEGPLPDDVELDHRTTCPKACVRPSHVTPGTHQKNTQNLAGARSDSASGIRGVRFHQGAWYGRVKHDGHEYSERFATRQAAEEWVVLKRAELFGGN
jgi:hypothetical protein